MMTPSLSGASYTDPTGQVKNKKEGLGGQDAKGRQAGPEGLQALHRTGEQTELLKND